MNTASRRCVDCLVVKKVYDACSKRECLERAPFCVTLPCGNMNDYTYLHTEFGPAIVEPYEDEPIFTCRDEQYARLRCVVGVPCYVVLCRNADRATVRCPACPVCNGVVQSDNIVRFPVNNIVYAPREFLWQGRFEPYCECYVETGCASNATNVGNILLSLGFFIVIKVVSDVQLKIPNFGFCDIPPECDDPCDENFCENFLNQDATPFPQFFPSDNT